MVVVLVTLLAFVCWIEWRYPLRPTPRYKFNSIIPRLLNTGAVTLLGWCFVRTSVIRPRHRAHEEYHHRCVVRYGRWVREAGYLWHLLCGLWRHRSEPFVTIDTAAGPRRYWCAYWYHPEEIAARAYADAEGDGYAALGGIR